jgi:hypothetical protein
MLLRSLTLTHNIAVAVTLMHDVAVVSSWQSCILVCSFQLPHGFFVIRFASASREGCMQPLLLQIAHTL